MKISMEHVIDWVPSVAVVIYITAIGPFIRAKYGEETNFGDAIFMGIVIAVVIRRIRRQMKRP